MEGLTEQEFKDLWNSRIKIKVEMYIENDKPRYSASVDDKKESGNNEYEAVGRLVYSMFKESSRIIIEESWKEFPRP